MKKRKNKKTKKAPLTVLAGGVAFSFAVLIILSLISSFILVGFKNPTANIRAMSLAVFLLTAAISGFFISKKCESGAVAITVLTALAFIAVLFAAALITSKGKISGALFMNYLCYMMISSFLAFLGSKKRKRHKR